MVLDAQRPENCVPSKGGFTADNYGIARIFGFYKLLQCVYSHVRRNFRTPPGIFEGSQGNRKKGSKFRVEFTEEGI